jgi:hypothetical protein
MPKKRINRAATEASAKSKQGCPSANDDESPKLKRGGKRAAAAAAAAAAAVVTTTNGDEADTKPAAKRKYTRKAVNTTPQYDYLNDIDSLAKKRSAKVCANRWRSILMARDNKRAIMRTDSKEEEVDSIFDCSDLIIPPSTELLEREVGKAIEKWKALDSRVIETDDNDDNGGSGGKSDTAVGDNNESHKSMGGRPIKERLLPPNFDYQCRNKPPDNFEEEEDDNNKTNKCRKRVISLLDPTQTLDYESELWQVFKSMPTVQEVEQQYALGTSDDSTPGSDNDPSPSFNHGCQHTLAIRSTLDKLRRKYTRIDAHSLGRLRVRDRHSSLFNYSGGNTMSDSSMLQTTLRFEVLKPNVEDLKRGSGPDGNRLEVELHGCQHTLLDLHHTLAELSSINCDEGVGIIPAGVFLIEDVIYTHGDVGEAAVDSILKGLDESNSKQSGKKEETALLRAAPDGDNDRQTQTQPKMVEMDGIKLEDITLRLGVRYTHINLQHQEKDGNISWDRSDTSALFVTGIHSHPIPCSLPPENGEDHNEGPSINNRVPIIIHDIWTSSQQSQTHNMCAACNYLPATVATVNDMMTDASLTFPSGDINSVGTPLCAFCFRELHYQRIDGSDLLQLRPNRSELKVFPVNRSW